MALMYCVKSQQQAEYRIIFFSFQLDIWIPLKMDCKCKNNPDRFYYIWDDADLHNRLEKIPEFVKKAYHNYFGVKLGDQYNPFIHNVCCKTCGELEGLEEW